MIPSRLPESERERLAVLRAYEILGSPQDASVDELTRLACILCGTPVALITLFDEKRQWIKSAAETDGSPVKFEGSGIPRETSFCRHSLLHDGVFEVPDALKDDRFSRTPHVASHPWFRFYAGQALRMPDGVALGTLCVLDTRPRKLSRDQIAGLQILGRQAMRLFEQQRALAQLANAEQSALEFSELKDGVFRMASHDLKNPLTAMMGVAGILELKVKPGTVVDQDTAQIPALLHRAIANMKAIIVDLLDRSAVSEGRVQLKREPVDLAALAGESLAEFQDYAQSKRIELRFGSGSAPSDAERPRIAADAGRLRQVISNLVGNAIKFSPPGRRVTVRVASECSETLFEVEDKGPGLRDEDMARLFTCYAKLTNKPTAGEHSSGIGLFICKQLIEAHGGSVGARNGKTMGSVFWFRLPQNLPDNPSVPAQDLKPVEAPPVRIPEDYAIEALDRCHTAVR